MVSCKQATKMDLECRREDISWWEFWMPLQLNCRMAPSELSGGGVGEGVCGGDGEEGGVEGGVK